VEKQDVFEYATMEAGDTSNVGVREFEQLRQVSNVEAISLVELVIRFFIFCSWLYHLIVDNHDSVEWFKIITNNIRSLM